MLEVGPDVEPEVVLLPQDPPPLSVGRTELAGTGLQTRGFQNLQDCASFPYIFHLISNKCVLVFYT